MLILIGCLIVIVLGIVCLTRTGKNPHVPDFVELIGMFSVITGGACLLIGLILVPVNRMDVNSEIHKIEAMQKTLDEARKSNARLENITIQNKVAELNQELASTKYYNKTIFDLWIPDRVEDVSPIK